MVPVVIAYFDRYSKTKILPIQAAGDEFFLPDNEV
jgi:PhoPQ-activated pathogenicity-related protein